MVFAFIQLHRDKQRKFDMRNIFKQFRYLILTSSVALLAGQSQASEFQALDDIRKAATDFAAQKIVTNRQNSTIETGRLDPRLRLNKCEQPLTVTPLSQRNNSANMTVIVKCETDKPWTVYIPIKVKTYITIAVANRPLSRHMPISKADISFEQREISRLSRSYFESPDNLIGRSPKRSLTKGSVISPRDLDIKKVISKGSRISILAETNGISVRMPGLALADAGKGEQIQVQNLSSKRKILATVMAPGIVKVTM